MNDLIFIKDNIYHLKHEYGSPAVFIKRIIGTVNFATGKQTSTSDSFNIGKIIPLPIEERQKWWRSLGLQKVGNVDYGDEEFLVDIGDVPSGKSLETGMEMQFNGRQLEIKTAENYTYAFRIVATQIFNKTRTLEIAVGDSIALTDGAT